MKYLGAISDAKDLVNKGYVDGRTGVDYTTSGNNRAVQRDSYGNLYVVQKDTNTHVAQTADTTDSWRRILGTANSAGSSAPAATVSDNTAWVNFDADGPAINTSTGEIYSKGYKMYLETSDALYTAINNLGWVSAVIE